MEYRFTIVVEPKTKKNSQQIIKVKGRPKIIPSKQYSEYLKACGANLPQIATITEPVNIKAIYYMKTKRRVDLTNLHEALHDILVHYKILEDDNSKIIVSTDGSRVRYDKENPRTEVTITKAVDDDQF